LTAKIEVSVEKVDEERQRCRNDGRPLLPSNTSVGPVGAIHMLLAPPGKF